MRRGKRNVRLPDPFRSSTLALLAASRLPFTRWRRVPGRDREAVRTGAAGTAHSGGEGLRASGAPRRRTKHRASGSRKHTPTPMGGGVERKRPGVRTLGGRGTRGSDQREAARRRRRDAVAIAPGKWGRGPWWRCVRLACRLWMHAAARGWNRLRRVGCFGGARGIGEQWVGRPSRRCQLAVCCLRLCSGVGIWGGFARGESEVRSRCALSSWCLR
jgi:hypothetical protein